ncbi:(deoxy)nucleoside triphosphate pyrophosphohydrolase [Ferruginibacter yonginensis]|uniref:8-oxo-dGTP diphosphatase n=1 Tax=Ferruginibacter yonginensis TaxID=1310416 RepID=A0ABV8QS65_9BACT
MKTINVTCAIIDFNGKVLVVQRSETMQLPLKWEFPGGKLEPFETEEQCILREIKEELSIDILLLDRLSVTTFNYPNVAVRLIPFTAKYLSGEITLQEHKQYLFLDKEALQSLDWAAADLPVLYEFLQL